MDHGHPGDATELVRLFHEEVEGLSGAIRGVLGPRADAAEVLQESFLKAWRAWQGGFRAADPKAWVFVVTLNVAKDLRRRRMRKRDGLALEEVDAMQIADAVRAPEEALEESEAVAAARAEIHRLRDEEKEVFLLRVSGGLSFEAIADALRIPLGTAKTRMRLAVSRLRERMSAASFLPQVRKELR